MTEEKRVLNEIKDFKNKMDNSKHYLGPLTDSIMIKAILYLEKSIRLENNVKKKDLREIELFYLTLRKNIENGFKSVGLEFNL